MDPPTCTVCERALAKRKVVAFVRLTMLLLLALLKVGVVFTRGAHAAGATDTRPRRSDFHKEAESDQKAIPTVCSSRLPRSGCRVSSGKASAARTSSVAAPVAF